MTTKKYHMSISIRGALARNTDELNGVFASKKIPGPDGWMNGSQAKQFLMDELEKGRRFLPATQCDGFDYQTGCPGHDEDQP